MNCKEPMSQGMSNDEFQLALALTGCILSLPEMLQRLSN